MKILLETTDNGIVIRTIEDAINKGYEKTYAFETETDMGLDDVKRRETVLWTLIDLLGWTGSRHDEQRLRVTVEEGDKFESLTEEN